MNMPDLLDENIMKPYKFLNSIVVYQPRDSEQRKEVLEYYIDKMNLQIDGESIEDVEKAIKNISETTYGFSVVDLMYLLETAQAVSMENGRDKINSSDFTEAFLQTISGRANTAYVDDSEKKIVSSHEAGHALNLQIMCEIAKKSNIPWHLPDNVDFITLDSGNSSCRSVSSVISTPATICRSANTVLTASSPRRRCSALSPLSVSPSGVV